MEELWPAPSARVSELIRAIAEQKLPLSEDFLDRLWAASQAGTREREFVDDPVLAEADRRLNKSNMTHWLVSNLHHPGRRVPPSGDREMYIYARDLVLRGMDIDDLGSWRAAQRVGWQWWIDACFAATTDHDELRELVEVSGNSMTTFVDDSIAAVAAYADDVRSELGRDAHTPQRFATAQLLLEGAPISRVRAEEQLGYALTGHHVAAIVWADSEEDAPHLEAAAEHVMRACGTTRRLTLVVSTAAQWLWMPARVVPPVARIQNILMKTPGIRVAFGRPASDVEGFRTSHLDAVAAQRLLARLRSPHVVVRYEDVQLVDLLTADLAKAEQFVATTLGELATADPLIQRTVRMYVSEGFNISSTADRMFAHRNTVDRRLARARAMLPRPLDQDPTGVDAALMLVELRQDQQRSD
ncbi:helix-turn-helix domain-containing protein [Streptomyces sp. NPDC048191]|uniref:PucR family transcriptional regulator n=1 Tax=unclassified Streptomyces TaxID=2593676 RepID=UPI0033C10AFC